MPPDAELNKAVEAAAEELKGEKKEPEKKVEDKPEVKLETEGEDETPEGSDETRQSDDADLSDEQKAESYRLYKALSDNKTAGPIVAALAQQMGLLKAEATPKEEKKAVRDIQTVLSDALGEYKFLAPQLGKAFEEILASERQEQEVKFEEIQRHRVEQEVVAATDKLARETKGESRKLEATMHKLSEEIPIGTMSVETYVRRLHTLASSEKTKSSPSAIADKIRRNANDLPGRLHAGRNGEPERVLPKEKLNLNKAVDWALQELSKTAGR